MAEFVTHNVAAVVALVGALAGSVVGGGLSFLVAWVMRRRDFDLKVWEKVLERRFAAHEAIVDGALGMRRMVPLGGRDSSGEVVRAPAAMMSREHLEAWWAEFAERSLPATTWLSTPVKREFNFVQDYYVTLQTSLSEVPSANFPMIGSFIRQDFIDLSTSLEKTAFKFFEAEARKLRLNDLAEHHKYPLEETNRRLQKTVLLSSWKEILALIQSGHSQT